MEAPLDKVWIENNKIVWAYKPKSAETHEYVRKDAFMEKTCAKLKKLMYDNLMFQGRLHREEVIDNFVEDFKNRIKGE
ncbi:hypothetical protein [uncultured Eubacterium sp.]|uniref:hypothetical protein n=1 Tax=uncultured Eubacterium sp. TaxID=165185 RepID=UPI0025941D75|nr:hypothetical protein [uncultured Eubacterium sp.]